jgi:hypothetical protein
MAQLGFAEIARKCPCGSLLGFRGSECTFASGLKAAKRPRKIPFHPEALPFRNHCSNLYVSSPRNNWGIRVLALLNTTPDKDITGGSKPPSLADFEPP